MLDEIEKLHRPRWQEELSLAYLRAVAATASVAFERRDVDILGFDATLTTKVPGTENEQPMLNIQVKSWTSPVERNGYFHFPLDTDNYNVLAQVMKVPSILVLFVMPSSREDWFHGTDEQGAIRHCAYWKSLQGEPPSENASTTTVYVAKQNQFSVEALRKMMERIATGGGP